MHHLRPGTVHDGTEGELYDLADDPLQRVNPRGGPPPGGGGGHPGGEAGGPPPTPPPGPPPCAEGRGWGAPRVSRG